MLRLVYNNYKGEYYGKNNVEFKDEKEKDNLIEFLNPTIKELIQRFILNQ